MQWMCWLCLTGFILFTLASLDIPQKKASSSKCEQVSCYQGSCVNGSCICKPGWTGSFCENCFGRVRLNKSSGFIIDSPYNYTKDSRCTWLLDGSNVFAGQKGILSLSIDSFATECGWDHVFIFDGDSVYSKQLAAISGDLTQLLDSSTKQYVVESGQAYVFFSSDSAYNMSGFNISFRWDLCPKNCSGRGDCLSNGTCSCKANWTGDSCDRPICSSVCVNGKCQNGSDICECNPGYRGPYCNITLDNDVWYSINSNGPGERASHAVALVGDDLYVVGGHHAMGVKNYTFMARYNFARNQWAPVNVGDDALLPLPRFDHSLVYYKEQGKLYMFGGVIQQRNITEELWSFDLASSSWSQTLSRSTPLTISPELRRPHQQLLRQQTRTPSPTSNSAILMAAPLAVSGHTAHVIRCNRLRGIESEQSYSDKMIIIHGYNPYFGYLNRVQEYFFNNNSWLIATTTGATVFGRYGHSSVYDDEKTNLIFVYGGFYAAVSPNGQSSDHLYGYDPCKRTWKYYPNSGYQTFLHSAVILSRTMLVFGGNAHNESMLTRPTACYSNSIWAFDIDCTRWRLLENSEYFPHNLARYGHQAVAYKGDMYIFGGFNGRLQNDVLKFTPADCGTLRDRDSCVGNHRSVNCFWVKGRCVTFADALSKLDDDKLDASKMENPCQYTSNQLPFDCLKLQDCETCVTAGSKQTCQWCNKKCRRDCTSSLTVPIGETPVSTDEACGKISAPCSSFYTCSSCKLNEDCIWMKSKSPVGACVNRTDRSSANEIFAAEKLAFDATSLIPASQALRESANACPVPCAQLTDCETCASSQCMWCSPLNRCIDTNTYLSSFPYGQCLQWSTNSETQCQETAPCSKHQTCAGCQAASPRCGWCDDGSKTGLGTCMEGGNNGPRDIVDANGDISETSYTTCPKERWYFFDCPACQCNGHAQCSNSSSEGSTADPPPQTLPCMTCKDETTGEHCDKCKDGYFGNALNGGNCSACECNSQATTCHPFTGKCYCTTKGVSGHNCDKCDQKYVGDPRNQSCYYELTVDFVFTFNLNSEDDMYITKINFVTRPPKENTDVTFKLTCVQAAGYVGKVNLTVGQVEGDIWKYRRFLAGAACHEIERRFSAEEFQFGTPANTTFLVMLYDFRTPISITVSFAQTPTIDWMKFFVTFALCFFILLVIAFALWKVKQRIDVYRRRQRMFVEMAQMASRPFASLQLELSNAASGRRQFATPLSIEPCANYRAAVLTIAVRMPTGGRKFASNGQSGLALASALCQLTPGQLAQLQTPPSPVPEQKCKRRRPACMS